MRLAYFSPLPPQHTGIADYSADLLPALASQADVTLFVDAPDRVAAGLRAAFPVRRITDFPEARWGYDVALYQMGNSICHSRIYAMALRYPGVVVLHDYTLHHLVASMTAGAGHFAAYLREMAYARGPEGAAKAREIAQGDATPLFAWPLNARLVDVSLGTLVHSIFVQDKVLAAHPQARVKQIAQPLPLPAVGRRRQLRDDLGLPGDAFILITCGAITPEKRLDVVLDAFVAYHRDQPGSLWLIAGEPQADVTRWRDLLRAANAGDSVRELGYVDGVDALYDYIAASDVCVNLRHPTAGETSASVLRALAVGTPVIVSDVGWYAELPDDVCVKITHDGTESVQVIAALESWQRDPAARLAAGERARAYVAEMCDPARVAADYVEFCSAPVMGQGVGQ